MEPRLATSLLVTALLHRAQAEGGFATVLARGDANSGAILLLLVERGRAAAIYERILQPNGRYQWQPGGNQSAENEEETQKFLARRRKFDPDMWILELDVPSTERFAAELDEFG